MNSVNKWMLGLVVSGLSVVNVANAAAHMLPEGSLMCDTAAGFSQQMDQIVQKNYRPVQGCRLSKSSMTVELVRSSLLGPTEVRVSQTGATIFVDGSALR
jgi:hypothetical protein